MLLHVPCAPCTASCVALHKRCLRRAYVERLPNLPAVADGSRCSQLHCCIVSATLPAASILCLQSIASPGSSRALLLGLRWLQGEQHGFRKAENIRSALEGEMFFYGQVLGVKASYSPELQPMTIDNLPDTGAKPATGAPAAALKDEL